MIEIHGWFNEIRQHLAIWTEPMVYSFLASLPSPNPLLEYVIGNVWTKPQSSTALRCLSLKLPQINWSQSWIWQREYIKWYRSGRLTRRYAAALCFHVNLIQLNNYPIHGEIKTKLQISKMGDGYLPERERERERGKWMMEAPPPKLVRPKMGRGETRFVLCSPFSSC